MGYDPTKSKATECILSIEELHDHVMAQQSNDNRVVAPMALAGFGVFWAADLLGNALGTPVLSGHFLTSLADQPFHLNPIWYVGCVAVQIIFFMVWCHITLNVPGMREAFNGGQVNPAIIAGAICGLFVVLLVHFLLIAPYDYSLIYDQSVAASFRGSQFVIVAGVLTCAYFFFRHPVSNDLFLRVDSTGPKGRVAEWYDFSTTSTPPVFVRLDIPVCLVMEQSADGRFRAVDPLKRLCPSKNRLFVFPQARLDERLSQANLRCQDDFGFVDIQLRLSASGNIESLLEAWCDSGGLSRSEVVALAEFLEGPLTETLRSRIRRIATEQLPTKRPPQSWLEELNETRMLAETQHRVAATGLGQQSTVDALRCQTMHECFSQYVRDWAAIRAAKVNLTMELEHLCHETLGTCINACFKSKQMDISDETLALLSKSLGFSVHVESVDWTKEATAVDGFYSQALVERQVRSMEVEAKLLDADIDRDKIVVSGLTASIDKFAPLAMRHPELIGGIMRALGSSIADSDGNSSPGITEHREISSHDVAEDGGPTAK